MMVEMARLLVNLDKQPHERGGDFCHSAVSIQDTPLSHWSAPGHDWKEEAIVQYY